MDREIVSVKIDAIFKKFFIEHEDMLQAFLSDILEIPMDDIQQIQILNPEMPPETEEGKFSRLDLSLEVNNQLIDVEIQLSSRSDFRERTLFYWAKLYSSGLKKGRRYKDLKRTIAINIVDFTLFQGREDYHTEVVAALKDTHEVFSDKFSIHFFELNKVQSKSEDQPVDRKAVWMQFFKADTEEALERVKGMGVSVMAKAVQIVYDMSADAKVRELARWREKSMLDMMSSLDEARTEGINIGQKRGEAQAQINAVQTLMKNTGKSLDEVLAMLSLTMEEYEHSLKLL